MTVQAFIDLIQRHEQSFYNFVHKVHSKGEGLFDSLIRWIELFLTLVREGMGPPISLEFLLPASEKDRADILSEVDAMATYHYKTKVVYEDKLRRRFGRAQAGRSRCCRLKTCRTRRRRRRSASTRASSCRSRASSRSTASTSRTHGACLRICD